MDAIGIIIPPVMKPPIEFVRTSAPIPQPSAPASSGATDGVTLSPHAAATSQTAQPKAQDIANPHILGEGTFSLFTVNGRLYTRFTSLNNGIIKVTYVPQQPAATLSATMGSESSSLLNIQA